MNNKQKTGLRRKITLVLCMCVAFMFTSKPAFTSGDSHIHDHNDITSYYLRLNTSGIRNAFADISVRQDEQPSSEKKAGSQQKKNTAKQQTAKPGKKKDSAQKKPAAVSENSASSSDNGNTALTVTATAYCGCAACNGSWTGYPAADGTELRPLHTVAAAESIPFGTKIYIPYFDSYPNKGMFEVHDRGSAITEGRIDIYFDSHEEALSFGMKELKIYIQ